MMHWENTGVMPGALQRRPDLPEHLMMYYQAFMDLSGSRPIGMAAGAIPFSEVCHYATHVYNVYDPDEMRLFWRMVHSCDSKYLELIGKDHKAKSESRSSSKK